MAAFPKMEQLSSLCRDNYAKLRLVARRPFTEKLRQPYEQSQEASAITIVISKVTVGGRKKKKPGMKASSSEMFFKDTELVAEPNGKPDAFVPHKDSY